ncbi:hypothetical protein IAU60_002747 [Kwoniella sp. DSM 27419]
MKRSASASPSPLDEFETDLPPFDIHGEGDNKPSANLITTSFKQSTKSPGAGKATSSPGGPVKSPVKKSKTTAQNNGTWDGSKKAAFVDEILAAGYKAADLDALADKLGLSKRQLIDQLVPNRPNLRKKLVQAARGE